MPPQLLLISVCHLTAWVQKVFGQTLTRSCPETFTLTMAESKSKYLFTTVAGAGHRREGRLRIRGCVPTQRMHTWKYTLREKLYQLTVRQSVLQIWTLKYVLVFRCTHKSHKALRSAAVVFVDIDTWRETTAGSLSYPLIYTHTDDTWDDISTLVRILCLCFFCFFATIKIKWPIMCCQGTDMCLNIFCGCVK